MNIEEIKKFIKAADICGDVPLISGIHGIGKSEGVRQYNDENNMHFEPLILSLMDTGDMLGIPDTEIVSGIKSTVWAAPSWYTNIVNAAWPQDLKIDRLQFIDTDFQEHVLNRVELDTAGIGRGKLNELYCNYYSVPNDRMQLLRQDNVHYLDSRRSTLFLDEFNRSPQDLLDASLQLINDHRLHSHILPLVRGQETLIVAAINPSDEGNYTVQEFDPAMLDRFVACKADPDLKSWMKRAKKLKTNAIVVDFLTDNPNKFHFMPADGTKGASPRSWTRLAAYMDKLEETPKEIMPSYVIGRVGSAIAAQFMVFYNGYGGNLTAKAVEEEIKAIIAKGKKDGITDVEELSKEIEETVKEVEAVRRADFAEIFITSYLNRGSAERAKPLMVYLYALPLESLSAVLKNLQADDIEGYAQLAVFDKELNNKKLFRKLVASVKDFS